MKSLVILGAVGGLALTTALVFSFGLGAIWHTIIALGWTGFALVIGVHLILIGLMGLAWWLLGWGRADAKLSKFVWGRLIRDSASEALPLSQLGGFVLGARAATLAGISATFASASTVVDVSAELVGQLFYTMLGLGLLGLLQPESSLLAPVSAGLAIMTGLAIGFYALQARGAAFVEGLFHRLTSKFLGREMAESTAIKSEIQSIHARRFLVSMACLVHFTTWVLAGAETWMTLRLMGSNIGLIPALIIDSLLYALRSAAFIVPNSLGVQEGGLILLGAMFGVSADVALGLSLVKRGRDLVIGLPALLVWQAIEGRRGLRSKHKVTPPADVARQPVA